MSANEQIVKQQQMQQLQQELQNELTSSNQLLKLVSTELQLIKQLTTSGSELDKHVIKNTSLIQNLASKRRIDLEKLLGDKK